MSDNQFRERFIFDVGRQCMYELAATYDSDHIETTQGIERRQAG